MRLRFFLSILLALFLIDLRTNAAVAQNSCTDAFQGLLEQRQAQRKALCLARWIVDRWRSVAARLSLAALSAL